ncbi:vesicle transport protein Sec20 isoform X2 [Tachypleus tridentatus]|uniref:vesicle transport protein Sec20 isoform X2 n=1 Tax=Tachypleus tridentatus TaxID=6853 RepID=UPI003FD0C6D6
MEFSSSQTPFQQMMHFSKINQDVSKVESLQQQILHWDLSVKRCIQDIRECSGTLEDLNTLTLLAAENMKKLKLVVDNLESLGMEQDRQKDREEVLKIVNLYRKELASNQVLLRKANLMSRMEIDKRMKEELLSESSDRIHNRSQPNKEGLARTASKITESIRAVSRMMADQVKQSESTLHSLVSSSGTVLETHEEYKTMGNVIHQSRKLLTKYNRREITDRVLIFLALAFFFACVLYVIKKRVF